MEPKQEVFKSAIENEEFRKLMEQIESSNAGQEKYAKKQYHMSQLTALSSILILVIVIYASATIIPRMNSLFTNLEVVMGDMQTITSELAETDLNKMITDVNQLVADSETGIKTATDKMDAIDIDQLNIAIQNLSDAVEPLAKFAKLFK